VKYEDGYWVTYIYLTDINKILVSDTVFIILKENSEVLKFFKDDERTTNEFSKNLRELASVWEINAKDILKKKIEVHNVSTLTDEVSYISPHFNRNTCFSSLIYLEEAFMLDYFNNIRKVYIRIDRDSLHVLKKSSTGIFISAELGQLKLVYIYDVLPLVKTHAELCNLRLVFSWGESEVDLKLYIKKREELLSVIITLRRITKNYVNELRFLLNDIEYYETFFISMPWAYTLDDYEVNTLKELKSILSDDRLYDQNNTASTQDFGLFYLLDEMMLNWKFTSLNKVDYELLDQLFEFIPFVYQSMVQKSFEEKDRCQIIKSEPNTRLVKEMWTKAKQLSRIEGFKYFKMLYSKLLNLVRLLANSKAYFKEIVNYEEIIVIMLESLNFEDTYVSCQSSQILASLISFKGNGNAKVEKINKEKLLSPKLNLIGHIKKLLNKWDDIAEKNPNDLRLLEINGAFLILMLFIKEKISGPGNYEKVNPFDKFIADAIFGEDKSLFHYLDKLALKGLFSVSYGAILLINRALEYYQKSHLDEDKKKEEHWNYYVLNNSVLLIWNIYVLMKSRFQEQYDESLAFISNLLYKNKPAVKVVLRMFQKSLFYKVEGADELFKEYSWTRVEWEQFFKKIKLNFNTATEQWNKQIRSELEDSILKQIENYVFYQKDLIYSKDRTKLEHPVLGYDTNKAIVMVEKSIKWNHQEYEVEYPSLKNLYKVGKYYLSVLLNEKPMVPYLIEIITSPIIFWNELNTRFHWTENEEEQIVIIKVMIKMYEKHFQMIKELGTIPFWIKWLSNKKWGHLHFWILQFLYVALSIPFEEYSKANYKMFKKANGMTGLFGVLNQTFKELAPSDLNEIDDERSTVVAQGKISNYTGIKENLHYFERNSMHINKGIVIIDILEFLFSSLENVQCIPMSSFLHYISKKRSINILVQLLLIENHDLSKVILNFFNKHMKWHFTLSHLLENGIVEALMLSLHTQKWKESTYYSRKTPWILEHIQQWY
jgi:hypothetical protein